MGLRPAAQGFKVAFKHRLPPGTHLWPRRAAWPQVGARWEPVLEGDLEALCGGPEPHSAITQGPIGVGPRTLGWQANWVICC